MSKENETSDKAQNGNDFIADVSISLARAEKYARMQHFLGETGSDFIEFNDWIIKLKTKIMTPKEKAEELVVKFQSKMKNNYWANDCAKLCVCQILDVLDTYNSNDTKEDSKEYKFYEEVYKELSC